MKKFYTSHFTFFLAVFLISNQLFPQSANFDYKDSRKSRYSATIYFSGERAAETISPDEFLMYDKVYFTIKPNMGSEKPYFKDGDVTDWLSQVKLYQDGREVSSVSFPLPITNAEDKIDRVILSYSKRDVRLYDPFVFINSLDTTQALLLDDKYYQFFNKYSVIYEEGINLSDELEYIRTFQTLMKIVDDATTHEEIKHYSFYQHASEVLIENAIRQRADSLSRMMEAANSKFLQKFDKVSLQQIDSIYAMMENSFNVFKPYFKMDFPKSTIYFNEYRDLLSNADAMRFKNYERFKNHVLYFLETDDYTIYKFQFFVDLLARMITSRDTLKVLNGLDTINIGALDKMGSYKEELLMTGWNNEFYTVVQMLNKDILTTGKVFNDSIMNNLQRIKRLERQPYQQIFLAFNELSTNEMMFKNYLKSALEFCTDEALMNNIEMWILSYNLTFGNIPPSTVHQINKGIMMVNQQSREEAAAIFNTITKQANTIAPPWYYLGKVQFELGEVYSAEAKFSRALDIYPEYIAPRLYNFRILYDQGRLDELLPRVEKALEANNIWLFHFWKAKVMHALNNFHGAIKEIEEHCVRLNPWDTEEYFLLGDAYRSIKKWDDAEAAYMKTQEINPYESEKFNEKMTELQILKGN